MKKFIKKISAIAGSALMIGLSMGTAMAANFPSGYSANDAIVVGSSAALSDTTGAQSIIELLGTSVSGGTVTVSGSGVRNLAQGSDYLYLNDDLGKNVQTITKDYLPTILADSKFTDDGGTDYDYEQKITMNTVSSNSLGFSNSDNDFDDPKVLIDLYSSSTVSANYIYQMTVTFNTAVNFTHADSEGEEITLFGKTYTVGTATDDNTLVLLGGSDSERVDVGETKTLVVGSESYDVTLNAISDATTSAQASITINGETKTFTQGQTKEFDGNDVYVKTVFRTGDNAGYIEVQVGADKLTLEHGKEVQMGSDNEDVEGTYVALNPTSATRVQALSSITISVAAPDNDNNHIAKGESFTDPVFGTTKLVFSDLVNGPSFEAEQDTSRNMIELKKGGNEEILVKMTDKSGDSAEVPFIYNDLLADDNAKTIHVVEGATIALDEYVILSGGDEQLFLQLTDADCDGGAASDVEFTNVLDTSEKFKFENHDFSGGYPASIRGVTFVITNVSTSSVNITSSDFDLTGDADGIADLYPYFELVSGEDYPRLAFTDEVAVGHTIGPTVNDDVAVKGAIYQLPTGTIQFSIEDSANGAAADTEITVKASVDGAAFAEIDATFDNVGLTLEKSIAVGEAEYIFDFATVAHATNFAKLTVVNISVDTGFDVADVDDEQTSPGILFVEGEDKSESSSDVYNAIFLNMSNGTYQELNNVKFSSTLNSQYDQVTWDDTDYTGYLTNWGSYVLTDNSDTNQHLGSLTYGNAQMYADVYVAEASAVTTSSTGIGAVLVKDSEVSTVSSKNLIVVGGSCVNSVAAKLLGSNVPLCKQDFTAAAGIGSGQFLIKEYDNPYTTGKVALLVAGYDAADTSNAATYLTTQNVDMSKVKTGYKGTSGSSATLFTGSA